MRPRQRRSSVPYLPILDLARSEEAKNSSAETLPGQEVTRMRRNSCPAVVNNPSYTDNTRVRRNSLVNGLVGFSGTLASTLQMPSQNDDSVEGNPLIARASYHQPHLAPNADQDKQPKPSSAWLSPKGLPIEDERSYFERIVEEEKRARAALQCAMFGQDPEALSEAIVRAETMGIDDSKLAKAEVVRKQLSAKKLRKQLQEEIGGQERKTDYLSAMIKWEPRKLRTLVVKEDISARLHIGSTKLFDFVGDAIPRQTLVASAIIDGMVEGWSWSPRNTPSSSEGWRRGRRSSMSMADLRGL